MNVIYAYIKLDENKIVYVGQTSNLAIRRNAHEYIDVTQPIRKEYDYPLSRGIRKYGLNNYKCIVLEQNVPKEKMDEREIYWIAYYNTYYDGYNQTKGGANPERYLVFSKETIDYAIELIKNKVPFKEISQETGISVVMLSEINTGTRHARETESYPLNSQTCGRKLTQTQINEIIYLLQTTDTPMDLIGTQFNVTGGVIRKINQGTAYKQNNIEYPIRSKYVQTRSHTLSTDQLKELINDLQNSDLAFTDLAIKYNVAITTIYNINSGRTRKQQDLIYPLRKVRK